MFSILFLVTALLIVNLCQGQKDYEKYRGQEQISNRIPDRRNFKTTSDWITNHSSDSSSRYYQVTPYPNGLVSNILSQTNTNNNEPPVSYYLDSIAHISPIFYEHFNPMQTTEAILSEQPVHAVYTESEIKHYAPLEAAKSSWKTIQTLPVHYNNKIYHINKRASPLANNKQKYLQFTVRKQRNIKKNIHNKNNNKVNDNDETDEKLIEQNSKDSTEKSVLSDRNVAIASSSSIKQPFSTSKTSHEIRYLHDIFLNYPKPHHVNFGHVELSPALFEKRFETLKAGNRYKGEVLWLDNTGGYAQHYWDLAQGKL